MLLAKAVTDPYRNFGLKERGFVQEGMVADNQVNIDILMPVK